MSCICVLTVSSQDSEMSCICVLGVSSQDSEMSCIRVLGVTNQESEMSCIFVLVPECGGYEICNQKIILRSISRQRPFFIDRFHP
jgi:hypothetical protein